MASVEELAKEIQQDMEIAMLNTVHVFAEVCTHVCIQRLQALREQLSAAPEHDLKARQDEANSLEAMYGGLDSPKYFYRKDFPRDVEHEEVNTASDTVFESVLSEVEPHESEQSSAPDDVPDIIENDEMAIQPAHSLSHEDDIMGQEQESRFLEPEVNMTGPHQLLTEHVIGTPRDAIKIMHNPSAATRSLPQPCRTPTVSDEADEGNKVDSTVDAVGREAALLVGDEEFEAALARLGDEHKHISTGSRAEATSIWNNSSSARARLQNVVRAVQSSSRTLNKCIGTAVLILLLAIFCAKRSPSVWKMLWVKKLHTKPRSENLR